MTTEVAQESLERTRRSAHARCVACGSRDGHPPRLRFTVAGDGAVEARVPGRAMYEGYAGMLHGGVIATLLDAAMTNCLFAHGHCGVTADLHIRYRHPVESRVACRLRAWIERASQPLFVLRAELKQGNHCKVTAVGKFMARVPAATPASPADDAVVERGAGA